jgi:hypothetical protein
MSESFIHLVRDSLPRYDGDCAETDPELFFPARETAETPDEWAERIETAKRICYSCPALVQCGADADARDERHGVWAGEWREGPRKQRLAARRREERERARAASA